MELYNFQKRAVSELLSEKHIVVAGCGSGKTAMALVWAEYKGKKTGKNKLLIVTTASKSKTGDFENEMEEWCTPYYRKSLSSLLVLSWHKLAKWTKSHIGEIKDYIVIFDEIQRGSAGVSSGMGSAFLAITKRTQDWAGFTGTPGDTWLKFYPYFTACGLVRCKTAFLDEYANVRTYKGYPEITSWRNEDKLRKMWDDISYAPDVSRVMSELPTETHKVVEFSSPKTYNKTLKTRMSLDGEFLDTAGALCAELRRQCFTKDKQDWVKDFAQDLESGCVFFYNFIKTGDELEKIIQKAIPKGAKVWRIDGKHHDIPTSETIGPNDMVLCQWQSGSEALNLQFLHYWVSVEACYSYSTSIQARGRIRRLGQKFPQTYWYLKTSGTIEDAIYECLHDKSEFSEKNWCMSNNIDIKEDNGI